MSTPQAPITPSSSRLPLYVLSGVLLAGVLVLLVFVATRGLNSATPTPTPALEGVTMVQPPVDVPDFTLTNEKGAPVSLESLHGKLTLMFFGYTRCPDYCPTTLESYKRVRSALGDKADQVQFVFVSVDGTRDTPEVIDAYLNTRGVSDFVIGLTGPESKLLDIGKPFGLFFEHTPSETSTSNYGVDHTTVSYLLDQQGKLRALYSFGAEPQAIADNIKLYL